MSVAYLIFSATCCYIV